MKRARPILLVEGTDDCHVVRHLLISRGFKYDAPPWPTWYPSIEAVRPGGGKPALLKRIRPTIASSRGRPVGFVLDANFYPHQSWASVANRLETATVSAPTRPPRDGFVGDATEFGTRVGVWMMPDNDGVGAVEEFVRTLIGSDDSLLVHAESCTREALEHGARFASKDQQKAILHAWLAWQKKPGRPYGTAIDAGYLNASSAVADRFVSWFRRLFEVGN